MTGLFYLVVFIVALGLIGLIAEWIDERYGEVEEEWRIAFDGVVPACNEDGSPGVAYGPIISVDPGPGAGCHMFYGDWAK